MKNKSYNNFLHSKIEIAKETGIDITKKDLPSVFKDGSVPKPHQIDSVIWAIKGGRRALFESFGLGKTIIQLMILDYLVKKEGGKALIVAPLGVRQEFKRDALEKLGIEIEYIKNLDEAKNSDKSILITNYERVRDGDIDPKFFKVTSLDEASVLRGFGTKTYQSFLQKFKGVKYKYVATATPSPNKYKELIHYGGYLEIMDTGQALTRFFKRDSTKANKLTLHPHKEAEFWLWLSSWALFVTKPSDLGYDDTGYDLPPLKVVYHELPVDHSDIPVDRNGEKRMFRDAAIGLPEASREKRESIKARVQKTKEIIDDNPDDHFILWHHQESERHAIKKAIPESVSVYGSQDMGVREKNTIDFSNGKFRILSTKPVISGQGCNFQRYCHKAIFIGIDYKFNNFIQSIHRVYRFLQDIDVEIHIIYTESEREILKTLQEKWKQHNYLVSKMTDIIKEYGLNLTNKADKMARAIGIKRMKIQGEKFFAVNNDCTIETTEMESNIVDLIHSSIPFGNHYEYSPSYNDFGHNEDNDKFFDQMDFLTPELLRVLKPGRVAAIHVKDRVLFGNATGDGMPTIDPFSDLTTANFTKHGFRFFGRITILTDVVRENNQTYRLGWTEQTKDGTKMGVGCPEYILLFRKLPTDTSKAYADIPVSKSKEDYTRGQWQIDAHSFWRSSGDRHLSLDELKKVEVSNLQAQYRLHSRNEIYNYDEHVAFCEHLDEANKLPATFQVSGVGSYSPFIWDDVNRMFTLNSSQARKNQTMHICPLQFDIVKRIINRFSNKGDVVYDPFAGLFTVPLKAVEMGRYGIGCELSPTSYKDGVGYLKALEEKKFAPTLFDVEAI